MESDGNNHASPDSENSLRNSEKSSPEWIMAREGIMLLINNKNKEAESVFLKYPDSLIMYSGYSYAIFMDALMSFEEDKLIQAISTLKEVERRCEKESAGWLKNFTGMVFRSSTESNLQQPLADKLENQIILADSQVCLAILTFMQQDISGYLKGGWVLRKAWKIYQRIYKEVLKLYTDSIGEFHLPDPIFEITVGTPSSGQMSPDWDLDSLHINGYKPRSDSKLPQSNSYPNSILTPTKSMTFQSNSKLPQSSSAHTFCNNVQENLSTSNQKIPHSVSTNLQTMQEVPVDSNTSFSDLNTTRSKIPQSLSVNFSTNGIRKQCNNHKKRNGSGSFLKKSFSFGNNSSSTFWGHKFGSLNNSISYFTNLQLTSSAEAPKGEKIDKKSIIRLMGSVCFGYGLFQLGISLLPPSLVRITSLLGFDANRQNGIAALMYARLGVDMRAPLATLALLWYHTIVRPFYSIDGTNVQAGVEAAKHLLHESENEFKQSALFLFFRGRVCRLNSEIPSALKYFQQSVEHSTQKELKYLALHEVGWCHLIELEYGCAKDTFLFLKNTVRWSRAFYGYLATICTGSLEELSINSVYDDIKSGSGLSKPGQLDEFLLRRLRNCPPPTKLEMLASINKLYWRLYVYELLYLWNALPSCNNTNLEKIVTDCQRANLNDEPMRGLSKLLLGCCLCLQRKFREGIEQFKKCLECRKDCQNDADDAHISAFAQYELGFILLKHEETRAEGKQLLLGVSNYSKYDFESRLNVRVNSILKQTT